MPIEKARVGDIEIAYEEFGQRGRPAMLLVMGIGAQMVAWHENLCEALAVGRHVIRFDNRDAGESTWLSGPVDLAAVFAGDLSSVVYTLDDMADDAAGLLDALEVETAHVVGASMGGMIAQTVAVRHPSRVLTLTSIMSTTGEVSVAEATEEAVAVLTAPPARDRSEAMERAVEARRVIGSPGFPRDVQDIRERAGRAFDRGVNPAGFARQLAAIRATGDRTPLLRQLDVPCLVVHGEADPLIPVSGGRATAAAIPGAELWTVPGMGHDLPRAVWPELIRHIDALAERADRARAA